MIAFSLSQQWEKGVALAIGVDKKKVRESEVLTHSKKGIIRSPQFRQYLLLYLQEDRKRTGEEGELHARRRTLHSFSLLSLFCPSTYFPSPWMWGYSLFYYYCCWWERGRERRWSWWRYYQLLEMSTRQQAQPTLSGPSVWVSMLLIIWILLILLLVLLCLWNLGMFTLFQFKNTILLLKPTPIFSFLHNKTTLKTN